MSEWFQIMQPQAKAAQPRRAKVYIHGDIGGPWDGAITSADFVKALAAVEADELEVHVNSPGGDIYDGIAILNAIREHPARAIVKVDGLAASAASVIAMAGEEVVMAAGSEMMIHDAWGMAMGNAATMTKAAANLERVSNNMAALYAEKGGTETDWRALMREETWFTAEEAVAAGLADRVAPVKPGAADKAMASQFDLSRFAYAGRASAPAPRIAAVASDPTPEAPAEPVDFTNPSKEGADSTMSDTLISGLRERLGIPADADLDEGGLLAALDEALAEQTEEPVAAAAPTLPQGTVAVDEATLAALRQDAAEGRAARQRQLADDRLNLVNAAVLDGRIAPSRHAHWVKALEADPGAAEVLASLAVGTVPMKETGYSGGLADASDDDAFFARVFGSEV